MSKQRIDDSNGLALERNTELEKGFLDEKPPL